MRFLTFVPILVVLAACASSEPTEVKSAASTSASCVDLATVDACPKDWSGVPAASEKFCATERQLSDFNVFVSTDPCDGYLRWVRSRFDAGQEHCLYDPATKKLVGHGAADPKAGRSEFTCGVDKSAYKTPSTCNGTRCPG